jgi:hypothetical protein
MPVESRAISGNNGWISTNIVENAQNLCITIMKRQESMDELHG